MSERLTETGDKKVASEIHLLPYPTWATPMVKVFSHCVDKRNGAIYYPAGNNCEIITLEEAIAKELLTVKEATSIITSFTKLYEGL